MSIELQLKNKVLEAIQQMYGQSVDSENIQIQKTRKDFDGDFTLVVFPLLRISKKPPEQTATEIGEYLKKNIDDISEFNVIKGFLNLTLNTCFWISFLNSVGQKKDFGYITDKEKPNTVLVEYSSPNTNKPLHLGHIRNNLLGYSVAKIIASQGDNVFKVNLVNDRGIHICKSMLAWQKWGDGITPQKAGKKGDHLVGDYYVKFDQEYKKQIEELIKQGLSEDDAKKNAPLILEAQEMLRKWEAKDSETIALWKEMNHWVLEGFDVTYKNMGIDFDRVYFESDTYKLGKEIVLEGIEKDVFIKREDGSVWVDLTDEGLDQKLLLRADGTSVYITQDIGTAHQRFADFNADELIYVVGNEQNYHFQVLKLIMNKLGYNFAEYLFHLSYGMVELPEGKMKSREGTVVDADDLMDEMIRTAEEMSRELGKLDEYSESEKAQINRTIGLGALKYFILKVDPKKNMTFDPKESIDFNGNTGPFIQYTYARIQSVIKKAQLRNKLIPADVQTNTTTTAKELQLIKQIYSFPEVLFDASETLSPAVVANYIYDLAKDYNQFYHELPILNEENENISMFRLFLSQQIGRIIQSGMNLLGIDVPERM
ncbi:MAG: arginine--tRNA ligase [Bacteroidetes bacterium GWF2_33_16]|nr:MAG: arginine--tRNA ligase [Bacteroidetes bacterium GWE2_32_14]OFY06679.1 MAG: arginine--tRNA ligase [Bacteroidetes bacterium GWF2_33_16]